MSAGALAIGLHAADPLIGIGITLAILRITLDSRRTVRGGRHHWLRLLARFLSDVSAKYVPGDPGRR